MTSTGPSRPAERVVEWTFGSSVPYADPFNDVEVDVVFEREGAGWRVPAFWRGGREWTVRFAPPEPGRYTHRRESTALDDPDLNGHEGEVTVTAYRGPNRLLRAGAFRVSADGRHFEHLDGTPFSWLADTWWTGMSDRLTWDGFQRLTADRKEKGFSAIQLVGGLVPYEELGPSDPGFANEGGPCWERDFARINPAYFDSMDRRIEHLLGAELVPVIVGAWNNAIAHVGLARLKQHWRNLIARYGAAPVFWIAGGEVADPPAVLRKDLPAVFLSGGHVGEWTELARYLRETDPYGHPVSVHEVIPDCQPIQDESLLDFRFFQPAHFGEASLATEVAQLNVHYAREVTTKPLIVGEIGYEGLGATPLQDFQRRAFWLGVLNGAAGHSYGANGVFESYDAEKPLHRKRWSFVTWEEGMRQPGSAQVGLGARLLRTLPWWRLAPHPEWVTPRGTTMFQRRDDDRADGLLIGLSQDWPLHRSGPASPGPGEWNRRGGELNLPYAAGVPGEVRVVYVPSFELFPADPPTVHGLEPGVRYRAAYWDPSSGISVDLGVVGRPEPGPLVHRGEVTADAGMVFVDGHTPADAVVTVDADGTAPVEIMLRYVSPDDHVSATYTPATATVELRERVGGVDGEPVAVAALPERAGTVRISAEVREGHAAVQVGDARRTTTSRIVPVATAGPGRVGVRGGRGTLHAEVRESPAPPADGPRVRRLHTAAGEYRGELRGPGLSQETSWDEYGRRRILLLDSYLPERLPTSNDWILLLTLERGQRNG